MRLRPSHQAGLVRGLLLLALMLAILVGVAGWWWVVGRFARPEQEPRRGDDTRYVLDYAGRRDLGSDPLPAMVAPDPTRAAEAGIDARLHFGRWSAAYAQAAAQRALWQKASAADAFVDSESVRRTAASAHVEYLHQAQVAEWWRARYVEAGGT